MNTGRVILNLIQHLPQNSCIAEAYANDYCPSLSHDNDLHLPQSVFKIFPTDPGSKSGMTAICIYISCSILMPALWGNIRNKYYSYKPKGTLEMTIANSPILLNSLLGSIARLVKEK